MKKLTINQKSIVTGLVVTGGLFLAVKVVRKARTIINNKLEALEKEVLEKEETYLERYYDEEDKAQRERIAKAEKEYRRRKEDRELQKQVEELWESELETALSNARDDEEWDPEIEATIKMTRKLEEEEIAAKEQPEYIWEIGKTANHTIPKENIKRPEDDNMKQGVDPNSQEAQDNYVKMMIAEFDPQGRASYNIRVLYNIIWNPTNHGDRTRMSSIEQQKLEYFGIGSKWAKYVSWGDLVMFYAEKLEYNLGEDVEFWVDNITDHIGISGHGHNVLKGKLDDINNHTYLGEDGGFGLFGIGEYAIPQLNKQLRSSIEKKVTFEMEYNAFLGSEMGEEV